MQPSWKPAGLRKLFLPSRTSARSPADKTTLAGIIDASKVLSGLRDLGEDEAVLRTIVAEFVLDTADRLEALEAALDREDFDAIRETAHYLKSFGCTLGLAQVTDLCEEIGREAGLKALPLNAVAELRRQLYVVAAAL